MGTLVHVHAVNKIKMDDALVDNRIEIPTEHRAFWESKIVAPGKELLANNEQYRTLPPAPASVTDEAFQRVLDEARRAGKPVYIEEMFAMPQGFVALPRGFYDPNKSKDKSNLLQKAAKFLPQHAADAQHQSEISSYSECCLAVRIVLQKRLSSVVKFCMWEKLKQAKIKTVNDKVVEDLSALEKAFNEHPTRKLLEDIYELFFSSIDCDPTFFILIEYETMWSLGIWYLPSSLCELSRRGTTENACIGFTLSQARCTLNDNLRKKFRDRAKKPTPHGISIGKSIPRTEKAEGEGKRKYERNKKGFNFDRHIKGWMKPRHTEWRATNGNEETLMVSYW